MESCLFSSNSLLERKYRTTELYAGIACYSEAVYEQLPVLFWMCDTSCNICHHALQQYLNWHERLYVGFSVAHCSACPTSSVAIQTRDCTTWIQIAPLILCTCDIHSEMHCERMLIVSMLNVATKSENSARRHKKFVPL